MLFSFVGFLSILNLLKSVIPMIVIIGLLIYIMKSIYDYGEKRWREGYALLNKREREYKCI
tara:strand:- start:1111 stop:1293 length:183 start_codon:yes stop_codon:yes gene_type:complete